MHTPMPLGLAYEGWEGYNRSLVNAISSLTEAQLEFRGSPEMRSVGELAWHIADGRVIWFNRINPLDCAPLVGVMEGRKAGVPTEAAFIVDWLNETWQMVERTLEKWSVDDLSVTFEHPYQGNLYAVSRQWVIWRIMAHDIHHGGQLSELLGIQNIYPLELTVLGGHLTEPPTVTKASE